MPLGCREEYQDAKYCGLLVARSNDLQTEIQNVASPAGFDFLAVPLSDSVDSNAAANIRGVKEFLLDVNEGCSSQVLGIVHPCVAELSADNSYRCKQAVTALRKDISLARYAGIQAVLLPVPSSFDCCAGYGQACVAFSCPNAWPRSPQLTPMLSGSDTLLYDYDSSCSIESTQIFT
jgi:hypothetical protein